MLKLRVSLGLAVIAAVLTAAAGLAQGMRPATVMFRAAVSLGAFFLGGYLATALIHGYFRRRFVEVNTPGKNIDIISKDGIIDNDELLNPQPTTQEFKPFVPENFEQVTAKE